MFEDSRLWNRSKADAFRIVVGGVIAASVFKLLIDVEVPQFGLIEALFVSAVLLVVIMALMYVLSYFLYQIESAAPDSRTALANSEINDISKKVVDKLREEMEE